MAAAVEGKDFYLGSVRTNVDTNQVDGAIHALIEKDLIARKPRSTISGEDEYTFRHILIRDVAYAVIPKSQRLSKHIKHAEWLQAVAGDRLPEFSDVVAHHWVQAVMLRRELGLPDDPRARREAIHNLMVAGGRAAAAYANQTALHHFSRAGDLEPEPAHRLRALLGRGEVWLLLGQFERAREDFAALRRTAEEQGEPSWEAVALDRLGFSYRRQDEIAAALQHLEAALVISRRLGDDVLTARILNHIGFTYFSDGRHREGIEAHEEARRLLEGRARDPRTINDYAESLHGLGSPRPRDHRTARRLRARRTIACNLHSIRESAARDRPGWSLGAPAVDTVMLLT
jgi:tetratricopeptide (TPR) repeat protein